MSPTALVLGAGPGIGLATALHFAREGFSVGVLARPGDPLEAFQGPPGVGRISARGLDLARIPEVLAALRDLEAELGPAQVLVYNASKGTPGPASTLTTQALLGDFQINAVCLLASVQALLPSLRAQGGTILVTGGGLAFEPKADLASASVGKAAQRSLALSLAQELEPEGIHVATLAVLGFVQPGTPLSPGAVAQALWDLHAQPREAWERERRIP
jgi:NAD(P)-dependent dehydrogenase (short-subunit alcohol dehydrogenase family)